MPCRAGGAKVADMSNAFVGKAEAPSDADLAVELGSAKTLWDRLCADLDLPGEWHTYSKKAGWSMRLKRGERNIVYLIPAHGQFEVSMVLGDRAVVAARSRGLERLLSGAKRYAEGTAIRFPVRGPKDFVTVKKLVKVKLEF